MSSDPYLSLDLYISISFSTASTIADMSSAKGITTTSAVAKSPSVGAEGKEETKTKTKTVQTVDYRESADGQSHDTRPVEVVHEIPSKENDPVAAAKQD